MFFCSQFIYFGPFWQSFSFLLSSWCIASEVTTLWRYTNLFIVIIIISGSMPQTKDNIFLSFKVSTTTTFYTVSRTHLNLGCCSQLELLSMPKFRIVYSCEAVE